LAEFAYHRKIGEARYFGERAFDLDRLSCRMSVVAVDLDRKELFRPVSASSTASSAGCV
jgi:hypothetical protein